eukprot:scaffold2089_cov195-Pinguiococcus_pyrenoidosus.AAC.1
MSADSERRRYPTTADFGPISSDLQTRKHTMSAREPPNRPEGYGEEPRWWRRVRSAYEDNETALFLGGYSIGDEGAKALAERGLPSARKPWRSEDCRACRSSLSSTFPTTPLAMKARKPWRSEDCRACRSSLSSAL